MGSDHTSRIGTLAWKNWGTAMTIKPNTVILHSSCDDVIPLADSHELIAHSGLPPDALIEIGIDHRLADPEPLKTMLMACEQLVHHGREQSKCPIHWESTLEIDTGNRRRESMSEPTDEPMELLLSFFEGVAQKGPGSKASTLGALSMLDDLPPKPRIVDFGCGSGAASLVLANARDCVVTAVDIHQVFLDELRIRADRGGVADRIHAVQADMADPPLPDQSFDLIWCEAAIYNVGFQSGLQRWRRLLSAGGCFAVSEVCWLTSSPPQKAVDFWQTEYPAITSIDQYLAMVRAAGYQPVGHFVMPAKDWQNYYDPLEKHLATFRSQHPTNNAAQSLCDSVQREIDLWKECGDSYGYVFYLGKVN